MVIYKYIIDNPTIMMPENAEIIKIEFFNKRITIWVLVDSNAKLIERKFVVRGTGEEFFYTVNEKYIGTVFDSFLVWHIFEILKGK